MKIRADRERCIGAGMCVLSAPELFDQDDNDGRVLLLNAAPAPDGEAAAREAVRMCPSGALTLTP
ncbi:ferredoxin [Nocardia sp. NPDC004068]|uniref:ferredoxin n=1 Tax=Nocardia sp. NPDC004068 TaxID=3364303 RepID=UPI0036966086